MAYAEESTGYHSRINEHASALGYEWRRLTRAATAVALITAPAFFLVLLDANHVSLAGSIIITVAAVLIFRGVVEVVVRRFIPWPSLFNAEQGLQAEDLTARRRYWWWRTTLRRLVWLAIFALFLLVCCQLLFSFSGISAPFFDPFAGLRQIFPPDTLPQLSIILIQLPILLFANIFLFMGPFIFMAVRSISSYEPGNGSWGVKIDDVRGQAEAKEEITRVITLWQSGEAFEKAGGRRERGLLFLGAPGTGKTMISKAIATNFNCPFVTIPGSGFAQMFMGMDALVVQLLSRRARKLARKWGGQCIVFIDEIDAVGMRRQALGGGTGMSGMQQSGSIDDLGFFGPNGSVSASGDLVIESRAWREHMFEMRGERNVPPYGAVLARVRGGVERLLGGAMGMGYQGQALQQLLVVMDGIGGPPRFKSWVVSRSNTFLDAMFVIPSKIGRVSLRLPLPSPRKEEIYFIGACNVPIEALDPALIRPGRMGRHIWFRTPTKDDRKDILDLYMAKVDHEPDLDTDRRRDELARITNGYSPSMIEQCCSMALTIAHTEGRVRFAWRDIVEAMTTVETGTAQNIDYIQEETRAVAIHEAGHAATGHVYLGQELDSTRLSIRKRGGSLGHYASMEKEERFSHFRSYYMGRLIMVLGAMASEHVFYGENSAGVSGDVFTATAIAASMVGTWAMGPDPVALNAPDLQLERHRMPTVPAPVGTHGGANGSGPDLEDDLTEVTRRLTRIGSTIMNRASGGGPFAENPLGSVLGDPRKYQAAAQLIGQAYVTAYSLIAANQEAVEMIAATLIERKEMHGDEVVDLLDSVGLKRPDIDLNDDRTWPSV